MGSSGINAVFDPSLKKKKKKKKTFDLDAAMETQTENTTDTAEVADDNKEIAEKEEDDLDLESFGKKKKKKKKVVEFDGEEKGAEDAGEKEVAGEDDIDLESFGKKKKKKKTRDPMDMEELEEALPVDDGDDPLDLDSFGKKKKKKRPKGLTPTGDIDADDINEGENKENESSDPWAQDDRDYTYDELLQRVFGIMRDKNPEMVAGEKKKFVMRPPQVEREGSKKTAFANFTEIAKMLHRQPKHLLAFLFAELGTSGAIDGSNQLIMKGRFQQKHRECTQTLYQGVRHLSHLQVSGYHPQQGGPSVLPPVHDLSLLLQCTDHQNRIPGCYREEKCSPCKAVNDATQLNGGGGLLLLLTRKINFYTKRRQYLFPILFVFV